MEVFQAELVKTIQENLTCSIALQILTECPTFGIDCLEEECELYISNCFDEVVQLPAFLKLSAVQLGRVLAKDTLKVSNEESVLKAVFIWRHADERRDTCLGLLFEKVRFPLMAASNLRAVEKHAKSIGPVRIDLQCAVRKGFKTHRAEDVDQPLAKRRCLPHWWSDWGSSLQGGVTILPDVLPFFFYNAQR